MKWIKMLHNNRNGSALIVVIILLLVSSILVTSVAILAQANTSMTSVQDQGIRSYYIARSGAELAYEVIFLNNDLMSSFKSTNQSQSETIDFTEGGSITGSASITMESFDNVDDNTLQTLKITSVGKAEGVDQERTVVLTIEDMDNEGEFYWSR